MPDTNNPTGQVSFDDAPGGDLDLDALFGNPEVQPTTASAQPEPQPVTPVVADEPFLKTATGTVYKTAEEAARGVEHKDSLIAQLRQQLSEATGNDPLKKTPQAKGPVNYIEERDAYFKDLNEAVEKKDTAKYIDVQRKLILDTIAPLAPTITSLVKTQAANAVETEIKDFRQFQHSDEYVKTLDTLPMLKDAIRVAESSPEAVNQLPELYKMAYLANQGRRLPEIVQSQRNVTPTAVRPTVSSTPVAAPATPSTPQVQPTLDTSAGRKAIIEQQERAGVESLKF